MELEIMLPSCRSITLHADLHGTVESVKMALEARTGIPLDGQTLKYGETELEDDYPLRDYNLHREHHPVIRLFMRKEEATHGRAPGGRRWL